MFGVYFATACAMFWLLYLLAKRYFERSTALWAVFLFTISIVQFEFYQWYYYRSFVAITPLPLSLLLFSYYSYFSVLPLVLAICLHPLSALPIMLAIFMLGWIDKSHRRYWWMVFGIAVLCICALNWRAFYEHYLFLKDNQWLAGNDKSGATESTGQFINLSFFLRAIIIYGIFGIIGIFKNFKTSKFFSLIGIFSLIAMICRIMFYRRLFVWLDLILIIYASVFLSDLVNRFSGRKILKIIAVIFFLLGIVNISRYISVKTPIISSDEFYSIFNSNDLRESQYVLSFSNKSSPWLYGYTDKKVIAHGMFEYNKWNYEEWIVFWYGKDKTQIIDMLNKYPTPLYLYLDDNSTYWLSNFENSLLFTKVRDHWYRFGK